LGQKIRSANTSNVKLMESSWPLLATSPITTTWGSYYTFLRRSLTASESVTELILILIDSLNIISRAFISERILLGSCRRSMVCFFTRSSSFLIFIRLICSNSFSWRTNIWCLCKKNTSFSCFLASCCFSWICFSSSCHSDDSRLLSNPCFCWRYWRSDRAIRSRWCSFSLVNCSSWFSLNFSRNNFS